MKNFDLSFTAFTRRDPVSGERQTLLRTKHSHQSSPRLKAFQRCMRAGLEGHTFRGGDAASNARAVRAAMGGQARSCARGGGRIAS